MTKRGLLLIDRGSREKEAKDELAALCTMIKQIRPSDFVDYCFLEVLPPFIDVNRTAIVRSGGNFCFSTTSLPLDLPLLKH